MRSRIYFYLAFKELILMLDNCSVFFDIAHLIRTRGVNTLVRVNITASFRV